MLSRINRSLVFDGIIVYEHFSKLFYNTIYESTIIPQTPRSIYNSASVFVPLFIVLKYPPIISFVLSERVMSWPYRFDFSLTPEQLDQRRYLLDSHAQLAQYSIIFPLLCFQLPLVYRFLVSQAQRFSNTNEKASTEHSERLPTTVTGRLLSPIIASTRNIRWVLENSVWPGWGTWKENVFGVLWASWLLALVFHNTGDGKSQCVPFLYLAFIVWICSLHNMS